MSKKNRLLRAVWPGCISEDVDASSGQLGMVLDHHCPRLDLLQYINALLEARSPTADTVNQVWAQKC